MDSTLGTLVFCLKLRNKPYESTTILDGRLTSAPGVGDVGFPGTVQPDLSSQFRQFAPRRIEHRTCFPLLHPFHGVSNALKEMPLPAAEVSPFS